MVRVGRMWDVLGRYKGAINPSITTARRRRAKKNDQIPAAKRPKFSVLETPPWFSQSGLIRGGFKYRNTTDTKISALSVQ